MPYGITNAGFVPKPLDDIKTDLEGGFRAVFGAAITVIAQSVFGQLIGIVSERLADAWQLGLATYTASFREGASGIQLDNIGALTGTTRRQASYTKVTLVLSGTNGTVISAGRVTSIPSTGAKFTNLTGGTISGGTLTLEFRASVVGPQTAYAGTVTNIDTPVAGWTSVTNPADHSFLGASVETDAAYRIRQEQELRSQGRSTLDSIRTAVIGVAGVVECIVVENNTELTDANGLPPHSFEVIVSGGLDADIAKVISDFKPVGIASYGTSTVTTTDGNGFAVNVKFSRPTVINIYVKATVTVDVAKFPVNGAALIQQAVANFGDTTYHFGTEVRASALLASMFAATTGALEITMPTIGLALNPVSSATIDISIRQLADLDSSRVALTIIPVVPV